MSKLSSGRFLLTIIVGLAFGYCVLSKTLQPEAISAIIMMVFTSYFNRQRKGE